MGTNEGEQLLLALDAFAPHLGEACRDDHERAHALAQRLLGGFEHRGRRQRDHGEVDLVRDLFDRAIGADAGHGLAVAVDREGGAGEVAGEDIAEELATDRAATLGGPDDRDASGQEEGRQRGDDRFVIAGLDARAIALRGRDRELNLQLAALQLARQLEARRFEDAEHRPVVGKHIGDEALDPDRGRARRELLEQSRADAPSLVLVGDGERGLGERGVAETDVVGDRDDAFSLVVDVGAEQHPAFLPVRLEQRLDEPRAQLREAVEAQVEAPLRQRTEEGQQGVGVVACRRTKPQRATVAEDDVGVLCRDHHGRLDCFANQWVDVPLGLPTLSRPTWPRSTCAKAWLTNGYRPSSATLTSKTPPPPAGTMTVCTPTWGGLVMSPLTQARSKIVPTTWKLRVQRRAGGDDVEARRLTGVGGQRVRDVLVRVAVEGRPVRAHRAGLRHVERGRLGDAVAVQVPLAGDEDVLVVDRRQRLRRTDDDRAVHAVGDVGEHRLGAAVVHEDTRVAGLEAEGEGLAGCDVPEGLIRRDPRGVEVDRVRDRATVRQRHLDGLALADVDDRAGGAVPVEGPRVVLDAGRDLDRHVLEGHVHLDEVAARERAAASRP